MKSRHPQAIRDGAAGRKNTSRGKAYPKDDAYMAGGVYAGINFRYTSWCVACRVAFKGSFGVESDAGLVCPHCGGPVESSCKRPVPWSRKGKRWARNQKYKRKE